MKTILFLITFSILCGCQPENSGAPSKIKSKIKLFSISVAEASALPVCDADHEGQLVYIVSSDEFKTCQSSAWQSLISNHSLVNAHINQSSTMTNNDWSPVIFNIEDMDSKSEYDNVSGVFTVSQSGNYLITVNAMTESVSWTSGNRCSIGIFINSTEQVATDSDVMPSAATHCTLSASKALFLNSGDTITIKFWQNRSVATNLEVSARAYNSLSIIKLR